jgi:hypothetical protein
VALVAFLLGLTASSIWWVTVPVTPFLPNPLLLYSYREQHTRRPPHSVHHILLSAGTPGPHRTWSRSFCCSRAPHHAKSLGATSLPSSSSSGLRMLLHGRDPFAACCSSLTPQHSSGWQHWGLTRRRSNRAHPTKAKALPRYDLFMQSRPELNTPARDI